MRSSGAHAVLLAGVVGGLACGGGGATARSDGTTVVLETDAAFAHAPDFQARLDATIAASLSYWGGTAQDLSGYTIVLVDTPYVECGGRQVLGCAEDRVIQVTTLDPGTGTVACIEQTVLVHEIGHAVIGDPNHTDPRWMQMDALASELAGRPGYDAGGEVPCDTHPSVWRHPLDSP